MKKLNYLTLTALFVGVSASSFTQNYTDTAYYKDGTSIPYFIKNQSDKVQKYNFCISPITVLPDNVVFMFSTTGFMRLNKKMFVDARFAIPYSSSTDNIASKSAQKGTIEVQGAFNYLFGTVKKMKPAQCYLASKYLSTSSVTVYQMKFEKERITKYYLSGGLDFLRTAGQTNYIAGDKLTEFTKYFIGNASSVSIMGGITRERRYGYTYGSTLLPKILKRNGRIRNYAYLTYAPVINYSIVRTSGSDYQVVNTGYNVPDKFRKLGWRFGTEIKLSPTNVSPYFGLEFGRMHGIKESISQKSYYGSVYAMVKLGIEFGIKGKK